MSSEDLWSLDRGERAFRPSVDELPDRCGSYGHERIASVRLVTNACSALLRATMSRDRTNCASRREDGRGVRGLIWTRAGRGVQHLAKIPQSPMRNTPLVPSNIAENVNMLYVGARKHVLSDAERT